MDHPRLLLDENIGVLVARSLEQGGFDVISVAEVIPGASDNQVIEYARNERRIVVTFDKDFGSLVFQCREEHQGVILLRLQDETPTYVSGLLTQLLRQHGPELARHFTVVAKDSIRIR